MTRVRSVLRRFFRVGRSKASAPDSITPFIRIVKEPLS